MLSIRLMLLASVAGAGKSVNVLWCADLQSRFQLKVPFSGTYIHWASSTIIEGH